VANNLGFIETKTCPLIIGKSGGMIESTRVQPDSIRPATPAVLNDLIQKPLPQALADIARQQSKLHYLDLSRMSKIQLCNSGVDIRHLQYVEFVERIMNDRC
jgi:hypothetical protein